MRSIRAPHRIRFCGERVRATACFGQSISGNFFGLAERRQVFALVLFFAKVNNRQRADPAVAAIRDRERRHAPELLGNNHCGDFVQILTAVLLGHFNAQQAEFSRTA